MQFLLLLLQLMAHHDHLNKRLIVHIGPSHCPGLRRNQGIRDIGMLLILSTALAYEAHGYCEYIPDQ